MVKPRAPESWRTLVRSMIDDLSRIARPAGTSLSSDARTRAHTPIWLECTLSALRATERPRHTRVRPESVGRVRSGSEPNVCSSAHLKRAVLDARNLSSLCLFLAFLRVPRVQASDLPRVSPRATNASDSTYSTQTSVRKLNLVQPKAQRNTTAARGHISVLPQRDEHTGDGIR